MSQEYSGRACGKLYRRCRESPRKRPKGLRPLLLASKAIPARPLPIPDNYRIISRRESRDAYNTSCKLEPNDLFTATGAENARCDAWDVEAGRGLGEAVLKPAPKRLANLGPVDLLIGIVITMFTVGLVE
ncbi:uncharacterized protein L203_103866 [Cryptococcus depauperatus CBS 7841]|uniref:Uncharacterized protein n=1 Tax=Cryptococcus depauperatus CBS 7841 TaxID=1295531 RepID=A0AAJ8JUD8_9TREE